MTEVDRAYLAGIIDGEGTIGVRKGIRKDSGGVRYAPTVRVQMVDQEAIDLLRENFNGSYYYVRKGKLSNNRDQHLWVMDFRNGHKFIEEILPFLRVKKPQAMVLKRYYECGHFNNGKKLSDEEIVFREECFLELKKLNRRGKHECV